MTRHMNTTQKKLVMAFIIVAIAGGIVFYYFQKDAAGVPQETLDLNSDQPKDAIDEQKNPLTGSLDTESSGEVPIETPDSSETAPTPPEDSAPKTSEKPSNDVTGKMIAHITQDNCTTSCKAYRDDLRLFEYCEQVCGITPVKDVENCDGKNGIQRDYCLKDLSIGKDDMQTCNIIEDLNIKKTCRNRILEEAMEKRI